MTTSRSKSRASDIDLAVGRAVRSARVTSGLSQQDLADKVGVTYQQMHKYERGVNRISVGRLFEIAKALNKPIEHFFSDAGVTDGEKVTEADRMVLEVARNLKRVNSPSMRAALAALARTAAEEAA